MDGQTLKSLAYRVRRLSTPRQDAILRLSPFQDENLLQNALLSFYYPSNRNISQQYQITLIGNGIVGLSDMTSKMFEPPPETGLMNRVEKGA